MVTYDEALRVILEHCSPLEAEHKPLLEAIGQVLAEDAYCDADVPQTDRARLDGYAVRTNDIRGAHPASPVPLRVVATVRAGSMSKRPVRPGTAVRIMTGSMLPEGADCVVPFEETDEPQEKNGPNPANPATVRIFAAHEAGANIGPAGGSARKGSLVVAKGSVIGPAQVSALSALGRRGVTCIRRPVVAIITTGDELVKVGRPLSPGQTYNSNAGAVAALVAFFGGVPRILGIARDKEPSLQAKLRRAMSADAIITTGGVSKGDYDIVRLLLGRIGEVLFSRIAMGPGASVAFAVVDAPAGPGRPARIPVFALSGPPTGALVNCETLVRPGLLRMRGFRDTRHPALEAEAVDSLIRKAPKAFVRWTRLTRTDGRYRVVLKPPEGMGSLAHMASANSLTIIPEGAAIRAGDKVEVLPLDWMGIHSLMQG